MIQFVMMQRRSFLTICAVSLGCLDKLLPTEAAESAGPVFGCFNRPWSKWGMAAALDGIKSAGYTTMGLLTRTKEDPLIGIEATENYLRELQEQIAARGLRAIMGSLRSRHDIELSQSIQDVRKQIDHAAMLKLKYVLTFGVDKAAEYQSFYRTMAASAPYAQDKGVKLVLKPHGGGSGASEEILRCVQAVNHPNFKVWYDAGNIIHYTGKDPIAELEPVASLVTGFCAKDCAAQKGDVMIQFGTGKVDFKSIFARLKKARFNGPIMMEGCAVTTQEETTANARANRLFMERAWRES